MNLLQGGYKLNAQQIRGQALKAALQSQSQENKTHVLVNKGKIDPRTSRRLKPMINNAGGHQDRHLGSDRLFQNNQNPVSPQSELMTENWSASVASRNKFDEDIDSGEAHIKHREGIVKSKEVS